MKNRIMKGVIKTVAAAAVSMLSVAVAAESVRAEYHFVQTQASEEGTVSIEEKPAEAFVNGYSLCGGYRVTYTISKESWNSFDDRYGGYFLAGDKLDAGGGCQFAYHTSGGEIWEDGAIILGRLSDAKQIAQCAVASGTVKCSFEAKSLSELPAYIAYAYVPASGAYVHITEEYGTNSHIWHYKSLRNAKIDRSEEIDSAPPVTAFSVIPVGNRVTAGGKLWSEEAVIQLRAEDNQSRPGGICLYQNGKLIQETQNANNQTLLQTSYDVKENGSYEMCGYDQLGNRSENSAITVSCIDKEAPVIKSVEVDGDGYVAETKIVVRAIDNGCGLNEKAYSFNGGAWKADGELQVRANGIYQVKVRDALGNESVRNITVSNIDTEAPEVSVHATPKGTVATCQGILWSTDMSICVEAKDEKSGMKEVYILDQTGSRLAEKISQKGGLEKTLALEKSGIKNGCYRIGALDCLKHGELKQITVAHVDSEPPVIDAIQKIPQKDGTVLVVIEAKDAGDGIGLAAKAYSFDGGKTWQKEKHKAIDTNADYEIVVRDRLNQSTPARVKITGITERKEDANQTDHDQKDNDQTDNDQKDSNQKDNNQKDNAQKDGDTNTNSGGGLNPGKTQESGNDAALKKNKNGTKAVSGNDTEKNSNILEKGKREEAYTTRKREVVPDKILSDAGEKALQQIEAVQTQGKEDARLQETILAVLAGLSVAGLLAFLLYLFLYYRRYSCTFYGIDEKHVRRRLCRLLVVEKDADWQVEVPEHKLGTLGTGRYVFAFHPSFVKEEAQAFVIILIDGKAVRERLTEEIEVSI